MPWAAHRVLDDQPLSKRPAVMGARGTDREDFLAAAGQQHRLVAHLTDNHRAIGEIAFGNTVRQVWLVVACVWHLILPATRVAASPPIPSAALNTHSDVVRPSRGALFAKRHPRCVVPRAVLSHRCNGKAPALIRKEMLTSYR